MLNSLAMVILFSGCATLRSKSVYNIPINTTPSNAIVNVFDKKGNEIIRTQSPDTLVLKASLSYFKRAEYVIMVSHNGFQTKKETLYFVMDGKYIDNIYWLHFMPIGFLLIDPVSGAMWMPEKQELEVILNPDNSN